MGSLVCRFESYLMQLYKFSGVHIYFRWKTIRWLLVLSWHTFFRVYTYTKLRNFVLMCQSWPFYQVLDFREKDLDHFVSESEKPCEIEEKPLFLIKILFAQFWTTKQVKCPFALDNVLFVKTLHQLGSMNIRLDAKFPNGYEIKWNLFMFSWTLKILY